MCSKAGTQAQTSTRLTPGRSVLYTHIPSPSRLPLGAARREGVGAGVRSRSGCPARREDSSGTSFSQMLPPTPKCSAGKLQSSRQKVFMLENVALGFTDGRQPDPGAPSPASRDGRRGAASGPRQVTQGHASRSHGVWLSRGAHGRAGGKTRGGLGPSLHMQALLWASWLTHGFANTTRPAKPSGELRRRPERRQRLRNSHKPSRAPPASPGGGHHFPMRQSEERWGRGFERKAAVKEEAVPFQVQKSSYYLPLRGSPSRGLAAGVCSHHAGGREPPGVPGGRGSGPPSPGAQGRRFQEPRTEPPRHKHPRGTSTEAQHTPASQASRRRSSDSLQAWFPGEPAGIGIEGLPGRR